MPTWTLRLALALVLLGQINYWPERLEFWRESVEYARLGPAAAEAAYGAADYDLLEWVGQNTAVNATLLFVNANGQTYGDPAYVLYHRAIYHLYPRDVYWATAASPSRYPSWWLTTTLTEASLVQLAAQHGASVILAVGFRDPPVQGTWLAYDQETLLIFLEDDL